jgi:hypothetical protein
MRGRWEDEGWRAVVGRKSSGGGEKGGYEGEKGRWRMKGRSGKEDQWRGRNVDKREEQTWDRVRVEGRESERTGDKGRGRERKEEKGR